MKKRKSFVAVLIIGINVACGQAENINTRDTITFSHSIIHNLIPRYVSVLNLIADKYSRPNEVQTVIKNTVKGGNELRIFTDESVIIEYDLKPGCDTMSSSILDKRVEDYLAKFNTDYGKQEDFTVALSVHSVSPLKKRDYFYYNVILDCHYTGVNSTGETLPRSKRLIEVKLVNDSGWHYYINGIRFYKESSTDTMYVFKNVIAVETDESLILRSYDLVEAEKMKLERNNMTVLLEKGDNLLEQGKYDEALDKYFEARMVNLLFREPIEKIKEAKNLIAQKALEERRKKERQMHIEEMKINAFRARDNYDFRSAKLLCDSLITDYQIKDDGLTVTKLKTDVAQILASIEAIESVWNDKNYEKAIKLCKEKIEATAEKKYKAEFYYRLAHAYFLFDYSENKIQENVTQAIELSGRQHQQALKLRAEMFLNKGETSRAVEDASQLINNDSRNPGYYVFRAGIYEKIKFTDKAINDYNESISYNTPDSTAYIKKTVLELNSGKYYDAVKTTSQVIPKTACYGQAYYYRGIAQEQLNNYALAGADFFKAKSCRIEEEKMQKINNISAGRFESGRKFFENKNYMDAQREFTASILLDSNNNAFFYRALLFVVQNKPDSAEADLTALIKRDYKYPQAFYKRGLLRLNKNSSESAIGDFKTELVYHEKEGGSYIKDVFVKKGDAEFRLGKYLDAAKDYETAGKNYRDDLSLQYSAEAYYKIGALANVMDVTTFAIKEIKTQRGRNFYWRGRTYYDNADFKNSKKDLDKALELDPRDDDAYFWRGNILMAERKYQEAASDFLNAVSSREFMASAYYYLGYCRIKQYNPAYLSNAVGDFRKAIEADSVRYRNAETYSWIAYACIKGNSSAALEHLEKAKKLNPADPVYNFSSACYQASIGANGLAINFLEKALSGKKFKESDIEDEPLLDPIRNDKSSKGLYKTVLKNYFP